MNITISYDNLVFYYYDTIIIITLNIDKVLQKITS